MSYQKIKAWARLILLVVLILEIVLIVFKNQDNKANLWLFFGVQLNQVHVIWLMVVTVLVTLVGFWVLKGVYRAYRDVKRVDGPANP